MHDSTRRGSSTSTPLSNPRFARQWAEALELLREHVGEEKFDAWFRSIRSVRMSDSVLELELPDGHYADWIRERFSEQLTDVVRSVLGPDVNTVLKASESSSEREQAKPVSLPPGTRERSEGHSGARSPYLAIPHRWLDELMPAVDPSSWKVFLVLLRFVWRGQTRLLIVQERLEKGELVAHVSRDKLARATGLSLETVRRCLRQLERLGVVRTTVKPQGRANLYQLGYRDEARERWFAEQAIEQLREG